MNVLIYGAGVLGKQVYHLLKTQLDVNITGLVDDSQEIGTTFLPDLKVSENKQSLNQKIHDDPDFSKKMAMIIAIGPDNLKARWDVFLWAREKGFDLPNLIHPQAAVDASASLGIGNIILANATIDYEVKLGDGNYVDIGCMISHNNNIGNNNFITTGCATAGQVSFGDHNFIGMHSTFTDGVQVGHQNLFWARNFVTRDVGDRQKIVTFHDQKSFPL